MLEIFAVSEIKYTAQTQNSNKTQKQETNSNYNNEIKDKTSISTNAQNMSNSEIDKELAQAEKELKIAQSDKANLKQVEKPEYENVKGFLENTKQNKYSGMVEYTTVQKSYGTKDMNKSKLYELTALTKDTITKLKNGEIDKIDKYQKKILDRLETNMTNNQNVNGKYESNEYKETKENYNKAVTEIDTRINAAQTKINTLKKAQTQNQSNQAGSSTQTNFGNISININGNNNTISITKCTNNSNASITSSNYNRINTTTFTNRTNSQNEETVKNNYNRDNNDTTDKLNNILKEFSSSMTKNSTNTEMLKELVSNMQTLMSNAKA